MEELQAKPDDVELRRKTAEALDASVVKGGERAAVDAVLAPLVNLTGHDDDAGLPCLCRDCLARAGVAAESAGMTFNRSFVIVGTRVLHFWMLDELAGERDNVRMSVASALRARLGKKGT